MNLDELYANAQSLIEWYQPRNDLYSRIDSMIKKEWDFPVGMPDWVLKVVSTDPADAVLTTVRTFATVQPRFKILPMLPNQANRDRANQIETAIAYNFKQAGRRNDASVEWDVMLSATKYADVAAQVIYLPYQEKILETMGKDTKRVKAARRFGDFAFIIHNPANVYPSWSEYGLEGVMTVRVQEWSEFVNSWGKLAEKLNKPSDGKGGYLEYVTVFDCIDYERRCVWAVCNNTETMTTTPQVSGGGIKLLDEENKLGFIPYAIRRWGDSLTADTDRRVMPLLQSIYDSGQWDMLNVLSSLDASLTMKRAAAVRFAGEFPPGQEPEIDNTEPEGVMKLPAGTRNFTPLPGQQVDNRLAEEKAQFRSGIWQTSIPQVLQNLQFPSGSAYSSINTLLGQAANALSPYKMLAQHSLEEIAHQMLCWIKYYGKEYGKVDLYGQYDDKSHMGQEVRISSDTIDPDALQIEVILTPDLPVDKLQQINGAVLVKNNFRVPEAELLEDLGYGDPVALAKRRNLEDFENTYIAADLQRIQMAPQLEMQQAQMEMQAGIQQQQQEQAMQQELAAREQEAALAGAQQNASPGNENLGGPGFNPAGGGTPSVQGNPGQR